MSVYFNEIDPVACVVLRATNPGAHVDERSVKDLKPDDIRPFRRAHFFAGSGLWEVACELAGWGDRPIWTASCPCQPFSVAGKGAGVDDPRHLWPDLFRLVRACRPSVLVGEQVAGSAGFGWFDGVCADLEGEDYACRAVDIPACAVDAPHRRQRLYWVAVADADRCGHRGRQEDPLGSALERNVAEWADGWQRVRFTAECDPDGDGWCRERDIDVAECDCIGPTQDGHEYREVDGILYGRLVQPERARLERHAGHGDNWRGPGWIGADQGRPTPETNGSFWAGSEWLQCADGKARRAKPGIRLLVDGMAGRADLLRLAGNSIVPVLAAEVLAALKDTLDAGRQL